MSDSKSVEKNSYVFQMSKHATNILEDSGCGNKPRRLFFKFLLPGSLQRCHRRMTNTLAERITMCSIRLNDISMHCDSSASEYICATPASIVYISGNLVRSSGSLALEQIKVKK
jgi:hypothetical protein